REERLARIRETMFTRSATIGFRETLVKRLSLRREEQVLTGDFGTARAKTVFLSDEPLRAKIEYDDLARVARERGISLDDAAAWITGH
ncbi:nickel insertion protein, partial [Treponema endosymbiont of Eucomonympha sp.]